MRIKWSNFYHFFLVRGKGKTTFMIHWTLIYEYTLFYKITKKIEKKIKIDHNMIFYNILHYNIIT